MGGYYQEYLSNLCQRRSWPEPYYSTFRTRSGFYCTARVNNREYQSDPGLDSSSLAKEDAAMQAYWRCQNFSRNDGMHPKDHSRSQNVQGKPIAIGQERASTYSDDSRSSGSRSGNSSPTYSGIFSSYGGGGGGYSHRSSGSHDSSSSKHSSSRYSSGSSSKHSDSSSRSSKHHRSSRY